MDVTLSWKIYISKESIFWEEFEICDTLKYWSGVLHYFKTNIKRKTSLYFCKFFWIFLHYCHYEPWHCTPCEVLNEWSSRNWTLYTSILRDTTAVSANCNVRQVTKNVISWFSHYGNSIWIISAQLTHWI